MDKYIQDGIIKETKDELIIYDDGSISYAVYNSNGEKIIYDNCEIYPVGDKGGMRIKYGTGSSFSFKDYSTGEIDKRLIKC